MSSVATCPLPGEPGLYGLGIRAAFYVQWFGFALIDYIVEKDLGDVRLLSLLSSTAAGLSLVLRLSTGGQPSLQPADIYVLLLLATGAYLFLVPVWIWRALTCCNPYKNPYRRTREVQTPVFRGCNFIVLLALATLQLWFWCGLASNARWDCEQYGFFFSPVPLSSRVFVAFHALLWLAVLLVCAGVLIVKSGWHKAIWNRKKRRKKISKVGTLALRELRAFANLAVAAVLVAAVELSIAWNHIPDAHRIVDVAQTLPLLVSAGFVVRVLFLHYAIGDESDSEGSLYSDGGSRPPYYATYAASYIRPSSGGPAWPGPGPAGAGPLPGRG